MNEIIKIDKMEGPPGEYLLMDKLNELIEAFNEHMHDVHGSQYYASKPIRLVEGDIGA